MGKHTDLTGVKFSLLTVLRVSDTLSNGGDKRWECICECGTIKTVNGYALKNGSTLSCGCYRRGLKSVNNHFEGADNYDRYHVFAVKRLLISMKARCYNVKNKQYKDYGGRGIKICDSWNTNIGNFVLWALSNGWATGLQIDRINNDGDYEPSNCRFVTPDENKRNKRNTINIEFNGEVKCLSQWANFFGINQNIFHKQYRLKGMSVTEILIQNNKPNYIQSLNK